MRHSPVPPMPAAREPNQGPPTLLDTGEGYPNNSLEFHAISP